MKKNQTLAATVMICVGTGCASGLSARPPPATDCPPGSAETFKRFDIRIEEWHGALLDPLPVKVIPVKPGPIIGRNIGNWGLLPSFTLFFGELFIRKNRVYGRFSEARLPSGEVVPICLEMYENSDLGVEPMPGGTAKNPNINTSVSVVAVRRFRDK